MLKTIKINDEIINHNIILSPEVYIEIEEIKTLEELILEYKKDISIDEFLVNGAKVFHTYQLKKGDVIKRIVGIKEDNNIRDNEKKIKLVINNEEMEIYYKRISLFL